MNRPTPQRLRRTSRRGRHRGVTLLELVIAILIVCILLAAALPRYHEAQRYGRIGMLHQVALAMHSATTMFQLQCLARQASEPNFDCSLMQVGRVWVRGENGFPQAGLDGIGRLAGLTPGEPAAAYFSSETLMQDGVSTLKVAVKLADIGTCELTYRAASGPGRRPEVLILQSTCP